MDNSYFKKKDYNSYKSYGNKNSYNNSYNNYNRKKYNNFNNNYNKDYKNYKKTYKSYNNSFNKDVDKKDKIKRIFKSDSKINLWDKNNKIDQKLDFEEILNNIKKDIDNLCSKDELVITILIPTTGLPEKELSEFGEMIDKLLVSLKNTVIIRMLCNHFEELEKFITNKSNLLKRLELYYPWKTSCKNIKYSVDNNYLPTDENIILAKYLISYFDRLYPRNQYILASIVGMLFGYDLKHPSNLVIYYDKNFDSSKGDINFKLSPDISYFYIIKNKLKFPLSINLAYENSIKILENILDGKKEDETKTEDEITEKLKEFVDDDEIPF